MSRCTVFAITAATIMSAASPAASSTYPIEVLFTAPAEVPINDLVPPPSPTEVTLFRGQPRIADDGIWYALYSFPLPPNAPPEQYVRNYVMLRDGVPWIREGLQLRGSPEFVPMADQSYSQQPFFDVSVGADGAVAQVLRVTDQFSVLPDGTPDPLDFVVPDGTRDAVVLDRAIVEVEGEEVDIVPGLVYPRNALESVSVVKTNAHGELLLRGKLDTGEGTFDTDLSVVYLLGQPGTPDESKDLLLSAAEDFIVPGLDFTCSAFAANEEDIDFNDDGSVLLTVDIRGASGTTDGAALLYDGQTDTFHLLAREGEPSPVAGRDYSVVYNVPVALNDAGDWAFRASLSGDFADNGVIVVNGEIAAQEGMSVGSAVPGQVQLGSANANIEMDQHGNIVWYGAWNALKADYCPDNTDIDSTYVIFEGIFYNDQLLLEGGVTEVHDVTIDGTTYPTLVVMDLPNTAFGGFALSPDGRSLIVHAYLAEPSDDICTYSINNDSTPVAQVLLEVRLDEDEITGDLNGDGCVDLADLGILLAAYELDDGGDLDGDGDTDLADLGALLANYGAGCP